MKAKCYKEMYTQYLLATFGRHSALWLSELLNFNPAHDSFTRWLKGKKLRPSIIWKHVKSMVNKDRGFLIIDDTVLDKWYSQDIEMVQRLYSGTHHRVVNGIGIIGLLWNEHGDSERSERIVIDFRIFAPKFDGKTKHNHVQEMLKLARYNKGFNPRAVLMDSWYSSLSTLKHIRSFGWIFLAAVKSNRLVSFNDRQHRPVADAATSEGVECHLKGFGFIKAFKLVRPNGDVEYLVTNDLSLSSPVAEKISKRRWKIEEYHRGAKQLTGMENSQARNHRSQRNHISCSILALMALEKRRLKSGISWYSAKQQLIAKSISNYLKKPLIPLP